VWEEGYFDIINTDLIKIILVVEVIDAMPKTLVLLVQLLYRLLFLHRIPPNAGNYGNNYYISRN
jgi:hypothetical protein